jgi:hypothetical protein
VLALQSLIVFFALDRSFNALKLCQTPLKKRVNLFAYGFALSSKGSS